MTSIKVGLKTIDNLLVKAFVLDFPLLGFGNKELGREVESPHSGTPLLPEISAPDPFIISKSRQLNRRVIITIIITINNNNNNNNNNRRVTLNVGGVRHEVMWAMLEQVPRSRLGQLATAGTHEQVTQHDSQYVILGQFSILWYYGIQPCF